MVLVTQLTLFYTLGPGLPHAIFWASVML
jgi:hypothetical protein